MSAEDYRASLRSAVRGYWSGALDLDQFDSHMRATMNRQLAIAWAEGAAECGVESEEDYSDEEWLALGNAIAEEQSHVADLALEIEQNRKGEGLLTPLLDRMDMWAVRYDDFKNRAKVMACKDEPLVWVVDYEKENCRSCIRLSGMVKRASYWQKVGVLPRVPNAQYLECRGFLCGCELYPTDNPVTKGPLPKLP